MQKIIIFGYSGMGRFVQYSLDTKQYQVVAFLDNCEKIWNGENKIPILSPEKVKELEYDFIVISLAEYEEEMKRQLISYGVSEEKIITFMRLDLKWQEPRYAMMRNCMSTIIERNIWGSMAELGVYKGEFSACLNQMLPDRKLYLFDTFEGFHNNDKNEKDTILGGMEEFKDTSVQIVMKKMIEPNSVIVKKGYFPDTAKGIEEKFCFVSIDVDLYQPTYHGLEYFYPRLSHGGYIFIHDFVFFFFSGVKKAVYEFCEKNKISFVPLLDKCLSAIITK